MGEDAHDARMGAGRAKMLLTLISLVVMGAVAALAVIIVRM